jgi:5-enolpyruvylshikimate-3-phosphate synthase
MATTTSITTTYAGEFASKYISAALLSASTIENGGIEVKPNIKYKEVIKKIATDDLLADGTCDFTATSTITLTERILQPKELQVNLQLCKADFRSDWDAISNGILCIRFITSIIC